MNVVYKRKIMPGISIKKVVILIKLSMLRFEVPEDSEQSGRPILSSEFHRTSSSSLF